jgi:uncharacterized protein YgbK (DUF1537 family)
MASEVIIADDITGAGDSGVHFALAGKRTAMLLERSALAEAVRGYDAVAVSSESRFLSPERAAEAVRGIAGECRQGGVRVAFKKVDSTLRGNPGAEIEAVLGATGHEAALVCVAMPKTGRTCWDGVLLLHGSPIAETEAGRDPFNPVLFSSIPEILAAETRLPIGVLPLEAVRAGREALGNAAAALVAGGTRIIVADAVTDGDLAALGALLRETDSVLLPVGAGGLAEALNAGGGASPGRAEPRGRLLAVIGSLTDVTRGQIRHAEERGDFHILDLDMEEALGNPGGEISRLVASAGAAGKRNLLLKNRAMPPADGRQGISAEDGVRAARIFGTAAKALCSATDCSMVYATGGSTAVAVAAALGLKSVTLERECMPGVVLSSCSCPGTNLHWFISKAGGFGAPDTLLSLAAGFAWPATKRDQPS